MAETEMMMTKAPLRDIEAQDDGDDEETKQKKGFERTMWTRIWQGAAIACVVLNLVAIGIEASGVCFVAGIVAMVVSAAVFAYQMELQDTDSLRMVQNQLRKQVNEFAKTNSQLSGNVNKLEGKVSGLKATEAKLETIAKEQGTNVDKLKGVVKENQAILDEKKILIKSDTMQAMMTVVLESDLDESAKFSDKEINRLLLRMKNLPAIKVDEQRLRAKVERNRSLMSVIDLLQDIDNDNIRPGEHVFVINEDDYQVEE